MRKIGSVPIFLLLAACASYSGHNLVAGQSTVADVRAEMGEPEMIREGPNGEKVFWYPRLEFGRESFAARIAPDGRLLAIEQRIAPEFISRIQPNKTTQDEVLDLLGPPREVYRFPRQQRETWEYPLRRPPERKSLYVQMSPDKVVRELYELQDERGFDSFFGFGVN